MSIDDRFHELLAAARAGDEAAWRHLYDALAPAIGGYLRARGAAEPDDLTGEVMLQVVRDLDRFDGDWRGFRAWAMTIAHNRLLDERRSRARRPVDPVAEPPETGDPLLASDLDPELAERIGLGRATELLGSLSGDQQAVVLLRVIADLSIEEVAQVLGKRRGAVKQLQRRGLLALRRALEREEAQP